MEEAWRKGRPQRDGESQNQVHFEEREGGFIKGSGGDQWESSTQPERSAAPRSHAI